MKYLKKAYKPEGKQPFTQLDGSRMRKNGFNPKKGRFRLDIREKSFTDRVVRFWNRLPRDAVDAPSLWVFKARLDVTLGNLILFSPSGWQLCL